MRVSDLDAETQRRLFGEVQKPAPSKKKSTESIFAFQCRAHRLPMFKRDYKFAVDLGRGWMFDFAWPECRVALEVEGLVVTRVNGELRVGGRHVTPVGFKGDCIKYGTAAVLGWAVLRFEQSQVADGTAIDMTKKLLMVRSAK